MPGVKTNERPGTRAELRHVITSAYKVREVLDLIRGLEVGRAEEVLAFCGRGSAPMIAKLLASAVANAEHNDGQAREELYVSACYADESRTLKRWRARARGRYTRIRKRTCHITIIVSRLPEDRLQRARARQEADVAARRARRVAGARKGRQPAGEVTDEPVAEETAGVEDAPETEPVGDVEGSATDSTDTAVETQEEESETTEEEKSE